MYHLGDCGNFMGMDHYDMYDCASVNGNFCSDSQDKLTNKNFELYLPKRMVIEDGMINLENEYRSEFRFIEDVDRIVDMGDWYHILFCFPKKSLYYVCQKNLLVEGTLEEFEKLFEGEIQRQTKNEIKGVKKA